MLIDFLLMKRIDGKLNQNIDKKNAILHQLVTKEEFIHSILLLSFLFLLILVLLLFFSFFSRNSSPILYDRPHVHQCSTIILMFAFVGAHLKRTRTQIKKSREKSLLLSFFFILSFSLSLSCFIMAPMYSTSYFYSAIVIFIQ